MVPRVSPGVIHIQPLRGMYKVEIDPDLIMLDKKENSGYVARWKNPKMREVNGFGPQRRRPA